MFRRNSVGNGRQNSDDFDFLDLCQTSVQVPVSIPVQSPVVAADQTHPNSSLYVGDDLDPSREWPKHNSAVQAVEKMNGISLGDDVLFVGRAQKKSE
uniref:Uncharacterized protein n=1 Tax=Brassica oleracea var. oleracea TaxID=109376 RepID=A0A0D3BUC9_BRAOL